MRRARGFVLVELLVALSLVALLSMMVFAFFRFAQKHVLHRQQATESFTQSQILLRALGRNIRSSRATLSLESGHWLFVNAQGETCSYSFDNGILYFDSVAVFRDSSSEILFSAFGQDSLLDLNHDQDLDLREMDLDADGRLDGSEAFRITRLRATIRPLVRGDGFSVYTEEAIRNRM